MEVRFSTMRLLAVVALGAVLAVTAWPRPACGQIPYSEDFESYALGAYPSPVWSNLFSGASASVSDACVHTGSRAFRIESYPTWARWDYFSIGTIPDAIGFRGAVCVDAAGRGGALGFGFMQPGTTNTGRWANAVMFGNDGNIVFALRTKPSTPLGSWLPGVWYVVGVQIDYTLETANLYLDGVMVASGVPCDPKVIPASYYGADVPLDQFMFSGDNFSGGGTSLLYLDDLAVGDVLVDVVPTTWGAVKRLYR